MVISLVLLLAGCDRNGQYYIAQPNPDYPFIQDLGEFRVISEEEQAAVVDDRGDAVFTSWSDENRADDESGRHGVYYGGLGAPEDPSYYGGATFNFRGTGGPVCVVVDPELVFWNQAQSPQATTSDYLYLDNTSDDGDLDLDVGLTSYYTGSPGVEMGNFELLYTDPAGEDHSLSFSQCRQIGYTGADGSHSGRSTVELCTVDTFAQAGVQFTGVLNTFLLPIDDGVVNFAVTVLDGACSELVAAPDGVDECFLAREADGAFDVSEEESTNDYCDDPENEWNVVCLENKFCNTPKKLNTYCEEHFEDDNAPCIDNGVHKRAADAEGEGI